MAEKSQSDKGGQDNKGPPTFLDAASPDLVVSPATAAEVRHHSAISATEWRGPLDTAAFLRREATLHATEAARDGGLTGWILCRRRSSEGVGPQESQEERGGTSRSSSNARRETFSGCETLRRRALVGRDGHVTEAIAHGIGSVFCPAEARGKGFGSRLMRELGPRLETWQQQQEPMEGKGNAAAVTPPTTTATLPPPVAFSFLYSDVGSDFYARLGWRRHPSRHIRLKPQSSLSSSLSSSSASPATWGGGKAEEPAPDSAATSGSGQWFTTAKIQAADIPPLCARDETLLRRTLVQESTTTPAVVAVAVLPTADTISWFHAREEFVASEVLGRHPSCKGAVVVAGTRSGRRRNQQQQQPVAWCLWTRSPTELFMLRLVVDADALKEEAAAAAAEEEEEGIDHPGDGQQYQQHKVTVIEALLREAVREAAAWESQYVEIWNPDKETAEAAGRVQPGVEVVERETDSITSLRWHGPPEEAERVQWVANEKFGWC